MDWGRNEKYPDCRSFRKIARWEHSIKPLSSLYKSFWERSLFSLLGLWWSSGICNDIETTFLGYNLHIILKQTIILYQGYNVYYFDKFLRPSTCWAWMWMFADVMWIKTRLKRVCRCASHLPEIVWFTYPQYWHNDSFKSRDASGKVI